MGTKVTLTNITSGYVGADIDANFDTVADEFDKVVYRDGTSPNTMTASLDMNSNEITNLAAPGNSQSAARLKDVQDFANDLGSGTAVQISIDDSGGNFTATNVEGALAELFSSPIYDSRYLQVSNNLSDLNDVATALTNLTITKTGSDTNVVSGTAGSDTEVAIWNTDGDLVTTGVVIDGDDNISGYGVEIGSETGTSWTLAADDAGKIMEADNASAVTVTVPANASVALPVGFTCQIVQVGAGQVTLSAAGGVTLRNTSSSKTRTQWSVIGVYKRATDEWVVFGDTE